ncbi:2-C-methyl-D-erythritol 4-phosphate cytidylyltransferase [Pilibacter termitis]|uniref:2-C-methyl-D-erythritol 4-phosphate cytidylyltransferase n=1 Tax=Pilibacter termitis TaxID=263852 RepID=A0A1T4K1T8_9ENTE|nr:2-C-methyl-D-erythritol 4-phosphate cytidylyltransferase [Pilibacter termitis]SJZ36343.1 2-C-methyl-D-erythritol 4-phosphate cytidylyltransferase [Pilibacter termitis]
MKYEAILLAAGSGKRMESEENKVFLELGNRAILSYSIDLFLADEKCVHLILVGKTSEMSELKKLVPQSKKAVSFVVGGSERQYSVYAGVKAIKNDENAILVHDGARPFVRKEQIDDLCLALEENHAVLLGVPVKDTIKSVFNKKVAKTVPREALYGAQTPQMIRGQMFYQGHLWAEEDDFLGTDDVSLVEEYFPEATIEMVNGSYENIKLTTPEDLILGEAILNNKRAKGEENG